MASWVPAWPKQAYNSPDHQLSYSRIYVATVGQRLTSSASIVRGFSTTYAPKARPRLFTMADGKQTVVNMSDWKVTDEGTILTTGLDSCVAIAVAAWDASKQRFSHVALAHLTGSYYPGSVGPITSDGNWDKLFNAMPSTGSAQLYAVVAGSSHRGGWYAGHPVMGGEHGDDYPSNPDRIWDDLTPKRIPKRNFLFYTLAPGICNTMGFAIRLKDGVIGEI